jgi:hypothetical protein
MIIRFADIESGWEVMSYVDLPFSFLLAPLMWGTLDPLLYFGTLGTLWWYLLSRAAEIWGGKLVVTIQKRRSVPNSGLHR